MRFTVDASVVVKWFASEELTGNAILLRAHRLELHAPDFLLAEFVNVFWKKSRREEIPDAPRYVGEIPRLKEEIALHSMPSLIDRAGHISLVLDHPVYECLYLGCAEGTGSPLVTADKRFVNKVQASALGIPVRYLGAEDFVDVIGAAAVAPVIPRSTVAALVEAYDLLSATGEKAESLAHNRLATLLGELSQEERIDLLAVGWFGQPDGPDWRTCHERACSEVAGADVTELARRGSFWRRGMERLFGAAPRKPC